MSTVPGAPDPSRDLLRRLTQALQAANSGSPDVAARIEELKRNLADQVAAIEAQLATPGTPAPAPAVPRSGWGTWLGGAGLVAAGAAIPYLAMHLAEVTSAFQSLHFDVGGRWAPLVIVLAVGALAGWLNGFLTKSAFVLPRLYRRDGQWMIFPGSLGNGVGGALAALLTVGLGGPWGAGLFSPTGAEPVVTPALLLAAAVAGFTGSRVLTGERNTQALSLGVVDALLRRADPAAAALARDATSALERAAVASSGRLPGATTPHPGAAPPRAAGMTDQPGAVPGRRPDLIGLAVIVLGAAAAVLGSTVSRSGPGGAQSASVDRPIDPPLRPPMPYFHPQNHGTYQLGQFQNLFVLRAPDNLSLEDIDGCLSPKRWDRSRFFRSTLAPPYSGSYYFDGCVMADANNLYLAADVNDPFPLRGNVDPRGKQLDDPRDRKSHIYEGGSIQIHLADLDEKGVALTNDNRVSVQMWSRDADQNKDSKTKWQGWLALNRKGEQAVTLVGNTDYRGRFRRRAGGYTVEYAIPWKTLRQGRALPGSRKLAFCWDVHWSNEKGDAFTAKLTEFVNADYCRGIDYTTSLSYADPRMWGTATLPEANGAAR